MSGSNIYIQGKTSSQTFSSNGTFTVPANVRQVIVEMWGAGGGGSEDAAGSTIGAFGGEAGKYVVTPVMVSPGANITITIGVGGSGATPSSSGDGGDGTDTSFGSVFARGGRGGRNVTSYDFANIIGSDKNARLPVNGVFGSAGSNSGPFDGVSTSRAGGDGGLGNGGNAGSGSVGGDGGIGAGGGAGTLSFGGGDGGNGQVIVYWKKE